jgi:hypothetical protein
MKNWKRVLKNVAVPLLIILAVSFALEDVSVRFKIPKSRDPLGSITVHRYYVLFKSKEKANVWPAGDITQTCVQSLFPHLGYSPCWFAGLRTEQRIDYQ